MSKIRAFLPAAVYYGLISVLSSRSNIKLPIFFQGIDKGIHVLVYCGLGACLTWGFTRSGSRGGSAKPGFVLAVGALLSGLDEIHQMFVPGRTGEWADVIVDVLGVLAGWVVFRAVLRRRDARLLRRVSPGATPQP